MDAPLIRRTVTVSVFTILSLGASLFALLGRVSDFDTLRGLLAGNTPAAQFVNALSRSQIAGACSFLGLLLGAWVAFDATRFFYTRNKPKTLPIPPESPLPSPSAFLSSSNPALPPRPESAASESDLSADQERALSLLLRSPNAATTYSGLKNAMGLQNEDWELLLHGLTRLKLILQVRNFRQQRFVRLSDHGKDVMAARAGRGAGGVGSQDGADADRIEVEQSAKWSKEYREYAEWNPTGALTSAWKRLDEAMDRALIRNGLKPGPSFASRHTILERDFDLSNEALRLLRTLHQRSENLYSVRKADALQYGEEAILMEGFLDRAKMKVATGK